MRLPERQLFMRTRLATLVLASSLLAAAHAQDPNRQLRTWAQSGQTERIRNLLAESGGVDIDSRDESGWTALMYSVKEGYDGIVQLLITAGADVNLKNSAGETALHLAAKHDRVEATRLLLESAADFTARDEENRLPLYRAIEQRHAEIIDMLQAAAAQAASIRKRPLSLGGSAQQTEPPQILRSVPAPYTRSALRNEIEGTVVLIVLVRRDGTIGGVSVSEGLEESLDRSALEAVRKWEFAPAQREGRPVDSVLQIEIDFQLPDNR